MSDDDALGLAAIVGMGVGMIVGMIIAALTHAGVI